VSRRIQTVPRADDESLWLGPAPAKESAGQGESYVERLIKYIPSEIIALYLGASNVVPHSAKNEKIALWVIAGLTAACTPVYMYYATREPNEPTLWSQIIISSIAFPIWVFAIGGPFEITFPSWYPDNRWIAAIVITFATFLLGIYQPAGPVTDKPVKENAPSAPKVESSVPLF